MGFSDAHTHARVPLIFISYFFVGFSADKALFKASQVRMERIKNSTRGEFYVQTFYLRCFSHFFGCYEFSYSILYVTDTDEA